MPSAHAASSRLRRTRLERLELCRSLLERRLESCGHFQVAVGFQMIVDVELTVGGREVVGMPMLQAFGA